MSWQCRAIASESTPARMPSHWGNPRGWSSLIRAGWHTLVGADGAQLVSAVRAFSPPEAHPPLYGEGSAVARSIAMLDGRG